MLFILLGLSLGSFFNVVIYRLPRGRSLIKPGSHCPSCRKPIQYFDNIPVLSYLILKGRCRNCLQKIPIRYPVVESVTALLFVGLYLKFGLSNSMLINGVLVAFLVPITFIDIDWKIIPDKLTIPGFILGLILVQAFHFLSWKVMILGSLSASLSLWLMSSIMKLVLKKETLGFGDVKMLAMTGVFIGFPAIFQSLFLGSVIALFFLVIGMAFKKVNATDRIPFGPFIALGIVAYLFAGQELMKWYCGF